MAKGSAVKRIRSLRCQTGAAASAVTFTATEAVSACAATADDTFALDHSGGYAAKHNVTRPVNPSVTSVSAAPPAGVDTPGSSDTSAAVGRRDVSSPPHGCV